MGMRMTETEFAKFMQNSKCKINPESISNIIVQDEGPINPRPKSRRKDNFAPRPSIEDSWKYYWFNLIWTILRSMLLTSQYILKALIIVIVAACTMMYYLIYKR